MNLTEERKIELSCDVLNAFKHRGITIIDRIDILNIAMKSLNTRQRVYERKKQNGKTNKMENKTERNKTLRNQIGRWKEGYCEHCYAKGIIYLSKISNKWFCSECIERGR